MAASQIGTEIRVLPPARARTRAVASDAACIGTDIGSADGPVVRVRRRTADEAASAPAPAQQRSAEEIIQAFRTGTLDANTVTAIEEARVRSWARNATRGHLVRVQAFVDAGSHNKARRQQGKLLRALSCRLWCLLLRVPAQFRDSPLLPSSVRDARRTARVTQVFANVEVVGRMSASPSPVLHLRPKTSGGHRPTMSFSWIEQARMRLLDLAITPFVGFHQTQYALQAHEGRRGRTAACNALLDLERGLDAEYVFLQADVCNFHGSISHLWLEANLALPRNVIRTHIHLGAMRVESSSSCRARLSDEAIQVMCRLGIPQGSAASARVAEFVMADILRSFAVRRPGVRVVVYSDNLGVVCRRDELAAIKETLRAVFASHGAGPFQIAFTPARQITRDHRFLGYNFQVRLGRSRAYIAAARVRGIEDEVRTRLKTLEFDQAEQYVRGVCASHHLWPGADALSEKLLAMVSLNRRVWRDIRERGVEVVQAEIDAIRARQRLISPEWRRWRGTLTSHFRAT